MATSFGPRGRMTRPLTTSYNVGDSVAFTRRGDEDVHAGDVGVIRQIFIADPDDGDDTFLLFDVLWSGYSMRMAFSEDALTPATKTKQLSTLDEERRRN